MSAKRALYKIFFLSFPFLYDIVSSGMSNPTHSLSDRLTSYCGNTLTASTSQKNELNVKEAGGGASVKRLHTKGVGMIER